MGMEQWLRLPEHVLAEAVNGEVFRDPAGLLTDCRNILKNMPEDTRRKRLAGRLLLMAQSGQYNYQRCLKHGETGAAQLAVGEFVDLGRSLEWLLTTDNGEGLAEDKYFCMEGIASQVIELLQEQGLTEATCGDLEKHAYSVNDGIKDGEVRNLHILYCVE